MRWTYYSSSVVRVVVVSQVVDTHLGHPTAGTTSGTAGYACYSGFCGPFLSPLSDEVCSPGDGRLHHTSYPTLGKTAAKSPSVTSFLIFHPANLSRSFAISTYFKHSYSCVYLFIAPHSQLANRGPLHHRILEDQTMAASLYCHHSTKKPSSEARGLICVSSGTSRSFVSPIAARRSSATARGTRLSTTWMCIVYIRRWNDRSHTYCRPIRPGSPFGSACRMLYRVHRCLCQAFITVLAGNMTCLWCFTSTALHDWGTSGWANFNVQWTLKGRETLPVPRVSSYRESVIDPSL